MTKFELIDTISATTGKTKKETKAFVEAFVNVVKEKVVSGDDVSIQGFGKFYSHTIPAGPKRNPQTGEVVMLGERHKPKFKASGVFVSEMKNED